MSPEGGPLGAPPTLSRGRILGGGFSGLRNIFPALLSPALGSADEDAVVDTYTQTMARIQKKGTHSRRRQHAPPLTFPRQGRCRQKLYHAHPRREEAADLAARLPSPVHLQGNLPP